ncbi:MAG: hypothetical protein KAY65_07335 [Planctomycetes bacterium]|nr:hypothetical protein [Planctomycetota bacterium]
MRMAKGKYTIRRGVTLVELAMASVVATVVLAGIAALLVDGQRGWNLTYNRVYRDVATDGYIATKKFDALIRRAKAERFSVDDDGGEVTVQYYADDTSATVDRYVRLFTDNGNLKAEYGQLNSNTTPTTEIVCPNVSECTFKQIGRSIQMILTLDSGTQNNRVVWSAFLHN